MQTWIDATLDETRRRKEHSCPDGRTWQPSHSLKGRREALLDSGQFESGQSRLFQLRPSLETVKTVTRTLNPELKTKRPISILVSNSASTSANFFDFGQFSSTVEEFFAARVPSSSAEVRGLVIHDIEEVEGARK